MVDVRPVVHIIHTESLKGRPSSYVLVPGTVRGIPFRSLYNEFVMVQHDSIFRAYICIDRSFLLSSNIFRVLQFIHRNAHCSSAAASHLISSDLISSHRISLHHRLDPLVKNGLLLEGLLCASATQCHLSQEEHYRLGTLVFFRRGADAKCSCPSYISSLTTLMLLSYLAL